MTQASRLLGKFEGLESGPLLICIGAMHGNEPAGVEAIKLMLKMLEVEPITNPSFKFRGTFIGLVGNLEAYNLGKRYVDRDMNRLFTTTNIERISSSLPQDLLCEENEIKELLEILNPVIETNRNRKIIFLDLHTTSSKGGIFSIATDDPESIDIAVELHAPVITGMLDGLEGTTLHYFNRNIFDLDIVPVTFESGQHDEELSVNRAIAAITNCMRTIGCVNPEDVENRHDQLLVEYSKNLPKVVRLTQRYDIEETDNFVMQPNYQNFQKIEKGELIASDKNGEIHASRDGRILMPLYQKQGEEGFFIVEEISGY